METTIYMVRHAESPFVFGEERSRGLSKRGQQDANRITEIMTNEGVDVIVSSPYARAIQTVAGIAAANSLAIQQFEELKERPIKGLDYKCSEPELLEGIKKSFEDKNYSLAGGETTNQAQQRVVPIIKRLLEVYKGKKIAIGTHGNIMTIIMNYFNDEYSYEFWESTSKPDIYKLVFSHGEMIEVERLWD